MKPLKVISALILSATLISGLAACSSVSGVSTQNDSAFDSASDSAFNTGYDGDLNGMSEEIALIEEAPAMGLDAVTNIDAVVESSIIKTGTLRVRAKNPAETVTAAENVIAGLGGIVENRYTYRTDSGDLISAELQLKVPSAKFESAFDELAELGKVLEDQREAIDVTLEHVDLKARIGALEDSIERLTELMKTADSTSTLIEAESALAERQQQLDGLNAQLNAMQDSIDYSRIWFTVRAEETIEGGPGGFIDGIMVGFSSLVSFLKVSIIALGVALPWILSIAVIIAVVWVIVRGRRRKLN